MARKRSKIQLKTIQKGSPEMCSCLDAVVESFSVPKASKMEVGMFNKSIKKQRISTELWMLFL